jgi:hypothetical protein
VVADHDRDVALGSTQRDRAYVDASRAERTKYLCGNPGDTDHAVANNGKDAQARVHFHALNLRSPQLRLESTTHDLLGMNGLSRGNRKADRVLGAALRDHDHGNPFFAERAKQTLGGARHSDHARALEAEQRNSANAGHAFDLQLRIRARSDTRARLFGRECIANEDRDAALDRWRHRLRMDHLRAEVGELHRFVVGKRVDHLRVRHEPRIRAQDTIDVGPDVDLACVQQRSMIDAGSRYHSGPAWSEFCAVCRDEAGDHQRAAAVSLPELRCESGFRLGPLHCRSHGRPLDLDDAARIQPERRTTQTIALLQVRSQQPGRPQLAVTGNQAAQLSSART